MRSPQVIAPFVIIWTLLTIFGYFIAQRKGFSYKVRYYRDRSTLGRSRGDLVGKQNCTRMFWERLNRLEGSR
jgi:hypothetical protein